MFQLKSKVLPQNLSVEKDINKIEEIKIKGLHKHAAFGGNRFFGYCLSFK